jgi:hypothetical protein
MILGRRLCCGTMPMGERLLARQVLHVGIRQHEPLLFVDHVIQLKKIYVLGSWPMSAAGQCSFFMGVRPGPRGEHDRSSPGLVLMQ